MLNSLSLLVVFLHCIHKQGCPVPGFFFNLAVPIWIFCTLHNSHQELGVKQSSIQTTLQRLRIFPDCWLIIVLSEINWYYQQNSWSQGKDSISNELRDYFSLFPVLEWSIQDRVSQLDLWRMQETCMFIAALWLDKRRKLIFSSC